MKNDEYSMFMLWETVLTLENYASELIRDIHNHENSKYSFESSIMSIYRTTVVLIEMTITTKMWKPCTYLQGRTYKILDLPWQQI